jgi:hypothetical protein
MADWLRESVVAAGMTARRKLSVVVARPHPAAALWLPEPEGFSQPSWHTALAELRLSSVRARLLADG